VAHPRPQRACGPLRRRRVAGDKGYSHPRVRAWLVDIFETDPLIPPREDRLKQCQGRPPKFDKRGYRRRSVIESVHRLAQGMPSDRRPLPEAGHPLPGHAQVRYDPAVPENSVLRQSPNPANQSTSQQFHPDLRRASGPACTPINQLTIHE
jgi:hypothetical protein